MKVDWKSEWVRVEEEVELEEERKRGESTRGVEGILMVKWVFDGVV